MDDPSALLPLAESVADGSEIDWEAAEARASGAERGIIRQLRILSEVAVLHRSLPADAGTLSTPAADGRTAPSRPIGEWAHLVLVEQLGSGAFGEVFRAWDPDLERDVALKLLRSDEEGGDLQTSRIAREGRLLARIRHSNVMTVHGVAVHEQRVGLWMDLVRGDTLEQILLKRGSLGAREAALVGMDLCRALAAIHGAGLIHRDIKAQNVMREDGGRIVLMDLGTGREIAAGRQHALSDLAGTPLYLAPEIFLGAPASIRTDIYSLGVLLYHLVTGAFPVRATTMDGLQEAHATGHVIRLRDARADLPAGFVSAVERAMASDPVRRHPSAGALESDLLKALEDERGPGTIIAAIDGIVDHYKIGKVLVSLLVVEILGFVNSVAYNTTLGRTGGFAAESATTWFVWGFRSIVAPLVLIALVFMLSSLIRLVFRVVPPMNRAAHRLRAGRALLAKTLGVDDPTLVAQLVPVLGAIALGVILWRFSDLVQAVFNCYINDASPERLRPLRPDNLLERSLYREALVILVLLLSIGVLYVSRLQRQQRIEGRPGLILPGFVVLGLAVLALDAPYRILSHSDFEKIDLAGNRCYIIGEKPGDLLLYCPDRPEPRNQVVNSTDPRLRKTGVIESIFSPRQ